MRKLLLLLLFLASPAWALSPALFPVLFGGVPFPLDTISAPAAAAYSSRKLYAAYNGPAWRVRRASGGELDIGFVQRNLDVGALLSFCAATDCFRVTVYDQTVNGRHRTQAIAANQPQVVTAGALTASINGRPGASFDGVSDSDAVASWGTVPQPFTRVFVSTRNSASGSHWINSFSGAPNAANYSTTGTNFALFGGTGGTPVVTWSAGESAVFTALFNDALSTIRKNGSSSAAVSIGTNGFAGIRVGSIEGTTAFYPATDYELVVFPQTLPDSDRQRLERNEGVYFGIPVL